MGARNTDQQYGWVTKCLHWVIGLGIIGMIIMGFCLHSIPTPERHWYIQIHKSVGMTILVLMVFRLIWRLLNAVPSLPSSVPLWQKIASRSTHFLLYCSAFTMTISGWLMTSFYGYQVNWFFLFLIPTPWTSKNTALGSFFLSTHHLFAWVFSVLIVIHSLAAIKHHFVDRDNVLKRMLPGKIK